MDSNPVHEHYCQEPANFPIDKFLQRGEGRGAKVLVVGEAPARNGWRKSGRAFYTPTGKLMPSGRYLNELLAELDLSIEMCGFTDLVKCYVGTDRWLLKECGRGCWPIFIRQVGDNDFSLIITLGAETLKILNRAAGTNFAVGELSVIPIGGKDRHLLPLFHTSPINSSNRPRNRAILQAVTPAVRAILADDGQP
jgi:uracil-DNA glycosylase family 4